MSKTLVFASVVVVGALFSGAASAQSVQFATAGTFGIAAERVTGFSVTKTYSKVITNGSGVVVESDQSRTHLNFLGVGNVNDPFTAPRLGFDYFIINGLSLGGSIAYATYSDDNTLTVAGRSNTDTNESGNAFVFSPRVGYCFMFSDLIGIWPRGGLTYWNVSRKAETPNGNRINTDEVTANGLDFSAEAMLTIVPAQHAFIIVGPTLDLPIVGSGKDKTDNNSQDIDKVHITNYGIQAGLGVWF